MVKKKELPPIKTVREILNQLKVDEKRINKLTKQIQEFKFFDTYTKCEEESEDIIRLTGKNIVTGEDNYLYINFKESKIEDHEITNGVKKVREILPNGIDTSLIKLM